MIRLIQTAIICATLLGLAWMARDREAVVRVVLDLTPLVRKVPATEGGGGPAALSGGASHLVKPGAPPAKRLDKRAGL